MISEISGQERREEIRLAVRTYLVDRPAVAPTAAAIHRGIQRDTGATLPEVEAACIFLVGLQQVAVLRMPLGASRGYQITSAGIIAHERGE